MRNILAAKYNTDLQIESTANTFIVIAQAGVLSGEITTHLESLKYKMMGNLLIFTNEMAKAKEVLEQERKASATAIDQEVVEIKEQVKKKLDPLMEELKKAYDIVVVEMKKLGMELKQAPQNL